MFSSASNTQRKQRVYDLWGYTPTGDKKKQFFHLLQTRKENKEFMVIL
jgi:hypothetical protein